MAAAELRVAPSGWRIDPGEEFSAPGQRSQQFLLQSVFLLSKLCGWRGTNKKSETSDKRKDIAEKGRSILLILSHIISHIIGAARQNILDGHQTMCDQDPRLPAESTERDGFLILVF